MVNGGSNMCAEHAAAHSQSLRDQEKLNRRCLSPEKRRIRGMYHTSMWCRTRAEHLTKHPYCEACKPVLVAAIDVDHIIPHRGDWALFLSRSNLQSLCHSCHSRKTASEDGGFGNRRNDGGGAKSLQGLDALEPSAK